MVLVERGQTFIDHQATLNGKTKAKYFIALSKADDFDDELVCFVINSERSSKFQKHQCYKQYHKFTIRERTFSFIEHFSSIILDKPRIYNASKLTENNIIILEKAPDILQRQIKNCIDFNLLIPLYTQLIKNSFK